MSVRNSWSIKDIRNNKKNIANNKQISECDRRFSITFYHLPPPLPLCKPVKTQSVDPRMTHNILL